MSAFDQPAHRFEQRGELGRGGMGRVDDAYDVALGRPVAIKHMLAQTEIDLARFEREARLTARLEHPGIVPIHDAGRSADGTPYYVMRRVDGQPLSELVEKRSLTERLKLVPNVLAACDAAGFAHARNIVHRDIKPTNILVGPFGETLLIDWGLARELESRELDTPSAPASDPQLTRAGTVAGTPGFMAPEQARGESVDARADVFALGATLFYVLSGELPWHGGSTEMIDHVGAGRPADWRKMPADVPPDLRAIVEKAMAPDLAQRYPDAGALAADLRRFTLGNLVAAYEYGFFAKLVRFARRHRAAMVVALVSAVVLAVVAVVSVRRVLTERDAANAARSLAEKRQREARAAADRFLVKHARDLVDEDPVSAIAALRTLPPDSPSWPEAWAVASAAYLRGVPFGFIGLSEPSMVQIASDDRHAFELGLQSGPLVLIDLQARTKRPLGEKLGRPNNATWIDPTHILCALKDRAVIIDIATGQQRVLLIPDAQVWSNRKDLALLLSDRKLYELTSATEDPHQIDTDIDEYNPALDLESAVVVRGGVRELWANGKTYKLPPSPADVAHYPPIYLVRSTRVAILQGGLLIVLDVVGDMLVEHSHSVQVPGVVAMFMTSSDIYLAASDTLRALGSNTTSHHAGISSFCQLEDGFVLALIDGSLLLEDSHGWFTLGKRRSLYHRLDRSPDGRFLIATTDSGEVLVWDLTLVRPRTLAVPRDQRSIAMTQNSVWVLKPAVGVVRFDLDTNRSILAVPTAGALLQFNVASDDRWAAALDQAGHQLRVTRDGEVLLEANDVDLLGAGDTDLVFVTRDGELIHWRDGKRETLTKVQGTPDLTAEGAMFAVVGVGHDLIRIDHQSKHEERAQLPAAVDAAAIDHDGTTWFVAGGDGYRWDLRAAAPVKLALGDIVDGVASLETRTAFHGLRTIIAITKTGEIHAIAHPSQWASILDGDRLATVTAQGVVSVLDLTSGASFEIPLVHDAGEMVLLSPGRIGFVYGRGADDNMLLGLIRIDVPNKPAELQRWLANVTNAKPVPNSEAIAWPN